MSGLIKWEIARLGSPLCRSFKPHMIRSALADYIIPAVKRSVQTLKHHLISYLIGGVSLAMTQMISYIPNHPDGLSVSYATFPVGIEQPFGPAWSTVLLLAGLAYQSGLTTFDGDGNDDPDPPESPAATDVPHPEKLGLIYARVSSNKQVESGYSLDTQVENLKEIADERNVELVRDPVRDEGKTGSNFERSGIKTVFEYAVNDKITHLLVDDISRIGRNAPQTIYFIYVLQEQHDVMFITSSGELDTTRVHDLLDSTLKALVSHMSAQERGRKALDTKIRRFKQERNWSSWYSNVPLGYRETDDGWIETDPEEADIVEDMFASYRRLDSYAKTSRQLNQHHFDDPSNRVTWRQVKHYLQNPVYVGRPVMNLDSKESEDEVEVIDERLQLVSQDTFERVQDAIEANKQAHSSSNTAKDVSDFVETFGLLPVLKSSPIVELGCPNCGGEMVKNGQRTLSGDAVHNYKCTACGRQRKFPTLSELEGMIAQTEDE